MGVGGGEEFRVDHDALVVVFRGKPREWEREWERERNGERYWERDREWERGLAKEKGVWRAGQLEVRQGGLRGVGSVSGRVGSGGGGRG